MEEKDINYWKNNCEEDYITTPISVLRYISELEKLVETAQQNHKKEITDAFKSGDCNGTFETINAEQYYNQTF
jgi:hypothetical protein